MALPEKSYLAESPEAQFVGSPIRKLCERPASLRLISSPSENYHNIRLAINAASSIKNRLKTDMYVANQLLWDKVIPDRFVLYSQGALDALSIVGDGQKRQMRWDLFDFLADFGIFERKMAHEKADAKNLTNNDFIAMLTADGKHVQGHDHPINGKDIVEFIKGTNVDDMWVEAGFKKTDLDNPDFTPAYIRMHVSDRVYARI